MPEHPVIPAELEVTDSQDHQDLRDLLAQAASQVLQDLQDKLDLLLCLNQLFPDLQDHPELLDLKDLLDQMDNLDDLEALVNQDRKDLWDRTDNPEQPETQVLPGKLVRRDHLESQESAPSIVPSTVECSLRTELVAKHSVGNRFVYFCRRPRDKKIQFSRYFLHQKNHQRRLN